MGKQGWREMWLKRRKRRFLISCEELQEQNLKQKIMLKYGSRDFFLLVTFTLHHVKDME